MLNDWDKLCKKERFGVNYGKFLHMCTAKSYTKAFEDISQELFMAFQVGRLARRAAAGAGLLGAGLPQAQPATQPARPTHHPTHTTRRPPTHLRRS